MMKKIKIFIGHRGVGKTSLLQRLHKSHPQDVVLDLDQEIERLQSRTISKIFADSGEAYFRVIEQDTFAKIVREIKASGKTLWMSLGAGFEINKIDLKIRSEVSLIWVSRKTDSAGRSFLNRPRLNSSLTPLDEYRERFLQREPIFRDAFDFRYELLEGFGVADLPSSEYFFEVEREILDQEFHLSQFGFTLHPTDLKVPGRSENICDDLQKNRFRFVELRDDLFNPGEIERLLTLIPAQKVLLSFRNIKVFEETFGILERKRQKFFGVDFDIAVAAQKESYIDEKRALDFFRETKRWIFSSHDETLPWESPLVNFWAKEEVELLFKWSPLAANFEDLHQHFQICAKRAVSYLPRSEEGRWRWLRLHLSPRNEINFVSYFTASSLDQPTLFEACLKAPALQEFAAVLGEPLEQSYSPAYHDEFFRCRKMDFYRIPLMSTETGVAWDLLRSLGLRAAAVTSPLKQWILDQVDDVNPEAQYFQAANTVYHLRDQWFAENTDVLGFQQMAEPYQNENILLWGGGGTKEIVKKIFPQAISLSSRQPNFQDIDLEKEWTLVWAAIRSTETQWPPANLKIRRILDLNYSENSMGLELAVMRSCDYISGRAMFCEQAREQQNIWKDHL